MTNTDFMYQLIPPGHINEENHYVFYDEHPRDNKKIDIIICTPEGEVLEFYKYELISSVSINGAGDFKGIRIMRNSKCELFYLVETLDEIIILRRQEKLEIHERISNVLVYEIYDRMCVGEGKIRIVTPFEQLTLDDNFKVVRENSTNEHDSTPAKVEVELTRKLNEANYNLNCNRDAYSKIMELRQWAAYSLCDRNISRAQNGDSDALLQSTPNSTVAGVLDVVSQKVKFCYKKIVILLKVKNICDEPINKVHVLIHNNQCNSISYTSKLFQILDWKEIEDQQLKRHQEAYIATVIPMSEFRHAVSSKIEFNILVSYEKAGRSYLRPCENIYLSARDVMGQTFDVFCNKESLLGEDDHSGILAILSTSEKTTLCLRIIQKVGNETAMTPAKILCKYLEMHKLSTLHKIVLVHNMSPHHILHGLTLTFDIDKDDNSSSDSSMVDVYTRSPSQVMALIHYIEEYLPMRILITTPGIQLTSGADTLNSTDTQNTQIKYPYASSLLKQASMTLEYLGNCETAMQVTRNLAIQNKLGKQIDIFAQGCDRFEEYRNKMIKEIENGVVDLFSKPDFL